MGGSTDVPEAQTADIQELKDLVSSTALENISSGMAVEETYRPEFSATRSAVDQEMLNRLQQSVATSGQAQELQNQLYQQLMQSPETLDLPELEQSQLLESAYTKALSDLNLGGALDRETQNLVTRQALATGGATGTIGGVAGRDIVARDLGLTSLDLQNQRLSTASSLGRVQQNQFAQQQSLANQLNQFNAQYNLQQNQNLQQGTTLLGDIASRDYATALQATLSTDLPTTGLDPSSIADIYMSNINAQNQQSQVSAQASAANKSANTQLAGAGVAAVGSIAAAALI